MSEFDDFIKGLGSDIKTAAEQLGKKADETFEISKRHAEKIKIKGRIQRNYQRLGEEIYGGMKNGEDVSEETNAIIAQLDEDFERIKVLYEEITAIKNGSTVPEEEEEAEPDWEEEYAEEYDIEETLDDEIIEGFGEIPEEDEEQKTETVSYKSQEFDIYAD